jgi:hypothetical protein
MAGGIEVDPDVLLGLEVGQDRPGGDGVGSGGLQVVDLDVQVQLHLLITRPGRPGGPGVGRLELNDSPAPPPGGRRVAQSGSSLPIGHPSSRL